MNRTGLRNVALVALLLLVAGGAAWWLTRPTLGSPDEGRRVKHLRGGFSLIAPEGWSPQMFYEEPGRPRSGDGMTFRPDVVKGRVPTLTVSRYATPPDPAALRTEGYVDATFQGRPALRWLTRTKYEHHAFTNFERDGSWYMLKLTTPLFEDVTAEPWRPFLESFRIEPRTARSATFTALLPPTSMPALLPMGPELPTDSGPVAPAPVPSH